MGNFLNCESKEVLKIMQKMKLVKTNQVLDVYKFFWENNQEGTLLDKENFINLLQEIIDFQEELAMIFFKEEDKIHPFEVFLPLIILSGGTLLNKCELIFENVIVNGKISYEDFTKNMTKLFCGLHKIIKNCKPFIGDIAAYIDDIWLKTEKDKNICVSCISLEKTLISNENFQQFMMKYQLYITKGYALKRKEEIMTKFKDIILGKYKALQNDQLIDPKIAFELFALYKIKLEEINYFIEMHHSPQVKYEYFIYSVEAVATWLSVDINNSLTLEENEIYTLIWTLDGIEPTPQRVMKAIKSMDLNHDGIIQFREWLLYLSVPYSEKGFTLINREIRHLFLQFDIDHSGAVDISEFNNMFHFLFKDEINKIPLKNKDKVEKVIEDIIKSMFAQFNINESDSLEWDQFKNLYFKLKDQIQKAGNIIKSLQ